MITKKPSHSYNQTQLKILCDKTCDRIEDLLDTLDITYHHANRNMISMCCPIHNGDNASALNIYHQGDNYRGNWKCRTHGCEQIFKGSIIGFVRGVISNKKYGWNNINDENKCSFGEAIDFIRSFLGYNESNINVSDTDQEKNIFTKLVHNFNATKIPESKPLIDKNLVRSILKIPADYYISRGYTNDILEKYDVGLCDRPNKEMSNRVVAPIYDNDGSLVVGCTGRSIFEQCKKCKSYHDINNECPAQGELYKYAKWKHSSGFKAQNHLYNLWFAKSFIKETSVAVIVESPGNVWRLEEAGIHNSVAIFGSSLSDRQKIILDGSGAMTIVILTDNDEAGDKAAAQIIEKCQNTYKIIRPKIQAADIGEMSIQDIQDTIVPILGKII